MALPAPSLPPSDLNYILEQTQTLWEDLRDQRIFITGGTGFFGCWLLESLVWANKVYNLNVEVVVLTRNPDQFKKKCPHLFTEPCLVFHAGDIQDFKFPPGSFSHLIHAATEVANNVSDELMYNSIVQGTQHTLEFAQYSGVNTFLLTSSGAIYGKQPSSMPLVPEEYLCSPADKISAYALGKQKAEELCTQYADTLNIKIARCFAFVGPHLPLDAHFAMGNFIRNGLNQEPIRVKGNGAPYRSYLYAADLAVWLWTILFRGENLRPYNVGSDELITVNELAHLVAHNFQPPLEVHLEQTAITSSPERYVPDVQRAKNELGLVPNIKLDQAIQATINWYLR